MSGTGPGDSCASRSARADAARPAAHRAARAPRRSDFGALPPGARARLVDSLCSNLLVLASACAVLTPAADTPTLVAHRGALKAYAFFLGHIVLAAEAEAKGAAPAPAAKARQP